MTGINDSKLRSGVFSSLVALRRCGVDASRCAWQRRLCVRSARCSVKQRRLSFHFAFAKLTGSSALRLKREDSVMRPFCR